MPRPEKAKPRVTKGEATRARLMDAAAHLVRTEGLQAATTTRIAKGAGVTQPAFYVHFPNVDACLAAAASDVAERILARAREARAAAIVHPATALADGLRGTLTALVDDPFATQIFLRFRRETHSALGKAMADVDLRARREMAEELGRLKKFLGVRGARGARHDVDADLLTSLVFGTAEAVIDGRMALANGSAALANLCQAVTAQWVQS